MNEFITKYESALTVGAWLLTALSCLPVVYVVLERWRYNKQFRRRVRASAQQQARLAVFDAWIRSGGRQTALNETIEHEIRDEYSALAMKHGEEYYAEFVRHETEADNQLMQLITTLKLNKGVTYEEE